MIDIKLPKVSICIPVYNNVSTIKDTIDSLLLQTYQNIEIICVNDGSTDNSLEILQQYSDKITIMSQKNHGLASALNLGIRKMKGHWFKWFSPDDVMYPHTIQTLVDVTKKYSDTILYSNWEIIDENGKKLREFQESNYDELSNFDYNIRLLDGQLINVNTALIPSSLLQKNYVRYFHFRLLFANFNKQSHCQKNVWQHQQAVLLYLET